MTSRPDGFWAMDFAHALLTEAEAGYRANGDEYKLAARAEAAYRVAQTAEILARHETEQPAAKQDAESVPTTAKVDEPTWDAEAIEATLKRAEAEGLRVRITWHPKAKADTGLTNERRWSLVEGKPYSDGEGGGVWELDDGLDSGWSFVIGESAGHLSLPGIIAAEIIDEPAKPAEPEPAEPQAKPWAAPDGWVRDGDTLQRICEPLEPYARESIVGYMVLLVGAAGVEFDIVRDYIARKERVTDGKETIAPLNDREAIIVDADRDVAIVEDSVLRSQLACLDREGER